MKVMVICAHPDDEVLGCGGTIAKLVEQGHDVQPVFLTLGRAGMDKAKQVADKMGMRQLSERIYLEDQEMDVEAFDFPVKIIESEIMEFQPETIYTHFPHDLNRDHRIVAEAVLVATRPKSECPVKEVYAFEIPSSTEWNFGAPAFQPNVFEEINMSLKQVALQCYESEMRDFPHPRSIIGVQSLAWFRGSQAGFKAAEAFMLLRSVRPSWTNGS